jgi:hypothetical protein
VAKLALAWSKDAALRQTLVKASWTNSSANCLSPSSRRPVAYTGRE